MPELMDIDEEKVRIVKEYIKGPTIYELVQNDRMEEKFLVREGNLYYIDYECNEYMEEWNFENWGVKYWGKTEEFLKSEELKTERMIVFEIL